MNSRWIEGVKIDDDLPINAPYTNPKPNREMTPGVAIAATKAHIMIREAAVPAERAGYRGHSAMEPRNMGVMGRAPGSLAHRQMLEYYVRPWRMPGRLCTRRKPFGRLPARSSATQVSGGFRWALYSNNAR